MAALKKQLNVIAKNEGLPERDLDDDE